MTTFHLQIVTPDGGFYDGNAEKLIVRALGGDVCILPRHAPFVTALGIGEATVVLGGDLRRKAACAGGMLSVTGQDVRLVATTFEGAENIDKQRAQRAEEKARKKLESAQTTAEIELAKAKLYRALARIKAAE